MENEMPNWDKEPFLAVWVDEIPPGLKEGDEVEVFGHKARIWLRSNAERLAALREALR